MEKNKDLPKRKELRLCEYDYASDGDYFITVCTHKRQQLLGDIVHENDIDVVRPNKRGEMIEKWLNKICGKYDFITVPKYVIMHDHIHFILSIMSDSVKNKIVIGEIIKWFKTQSTNEYIQCVKNGIYPRFDEHVWQRNYYEHIIRNEKDWFEIWEYIENNPVKWGEDHWMK